VHGVAVAAPTIEAAAASAPDVAITQLALGRLRLAQNRIADGLAALGRAAALAPDDFLVQLALGGWLVRRGGTAPETEQAALDALRRAAALNPASAEPHARIAAIQARKDATLDEARGSLRRAIALAPGRLEYSVRLAELYERAGDLPPARAILSAVAAGTSDPRLARAAAQRLDRIAQRERARSAAQAAPPNP
jgi:tetratricopeptide (TPR) repeat protein